MNQPPKPKKYCPYPIELYIKQKIDSLIIHHNADGWIDFKFIDSKEEEWELTYQPHRLLISSGFIREVTDRFETNRITISNIITSLLPYRIDSTRFVAETGHLSEIYYETII